MLRGLLKGRFTLFLIVLILINGCVTEQKILNKLNDKDICRNIKFFSVETIELTGPGFVILKDDLCPLINEYESNQFWQVKGKINENEELVILVDSNLNLICKYILDRRAAPGIMPYREEICNE